MSVCDLALRKGNTLMVYGDRLTNALQRIAARWRMGTKLKGSIWAARAEGRR
jgi:hypothetical protein